MILPSVGFQIRFFPINIHEFDDGVKNITGTFKEQAIDLWWYVSIQNVGSINSK